MDKATLTLERARELLNYDPQTGVFLWKVITSKRVRVGGVAGSLNKSTGYVHISVDGRRYKAHRLAWLMVHGEWPRLKIDHINGDRADNRICNIRVATEFQNAQNTSKRSDNTSGFKGVSFERRRGKWLAQIKAKKKQIYLGRYACPTAAHIAYCKAAKEHFGEYARTA